MVSQSQRPTRPPARAAGAAVLALLTAAILGGCQPSLVFEGQASRFQVTLEGVRLDPAGVAPAPLLAGSRPCLEFTAWRTSTQDPWRSSHPHAPIGECLTTQVSGPAVPVPATESCLELQGPGEVEIAITPAGPCSLHGTPVSLAPDTLLLESVPASAVTPLARPWPQLYASRALANLDGLALVGAAELPPEWGTLPSTARVPSGGGLTLAVGLVLASDPQVFVIHGPELLSLTTDVQRRRPWVHLTDGTFLSAELLEGEHVTVSARVSDQAPQPLVTLAGTPPCPAASLELLAVVDRDEVDGEQLPLYVQAVVRDAAGDLLYGTPIEWSDATGTLTFPPWREQLGEMPLATADALIEPTRDLPEVDVPTPREVEIVARYCDLEDTLRFSWTQVPRGDVETPDDPPAITTSGSDSTGDTGADAPAGEDPSGCACRPTTPEPPGAAPFAALVLLAGARRRTLARHPGG